MNPSFNIVSILNCMTRKEYVRSPYNENTVPYKLASQIPEQSWMQCNPRQTEEQRADSDFSSKDKKPRTCFSKTQIALLEQKFVIKKYLSAVERSIIAAELKMTDAQVKTWFQNRRTKWRRHEADERTRGLQRCDFSHMCQQ